MRAVTQSADCSGTLAPASHKHNPGGHFGLGLDLQMGQHAGCAAHVLASLTWSGDQGWRVRRNGDQSNPESQFLLP